MEGQSNWYYGETWIKERSAEVVRSGREAIRDTQVSRLRRERIRQQRHARRRDRNIARLLAGIERQRLSEQASSLRQRLGGWVLRLVGGHS